MSHFKKDCKCLECGCHFSIFSWHRVNKKHYRPYCPECGKQTVSHLSLVEDDREIYEVCGAQPATLEDELEVLKLQDKK